MIYLLVEEYWFLGFRSSGKGRFGMRTAIVTDTNCGITAALAEELGVHLIPMPFFIGGETYYEGKDITFEFFFQKMREGVEVSTSQPSPEAVTGLWEELLKDHDAVLHFAMSSGISGTCQTATALAQEYGGRVQVVDDHRISATLLQSIRNARTLVDQGKTAQEISRCNTRDTLSITGRLQSRIYTKLTEAGSEERTAYEISALTASAECAEN